MVCLLSAELRAAAMPNGQPAAGAFDKYAAHGFGCRCEKMRAVIKLRLTALIHDPQPCLVDQRGGLERVAGALARHFRRRQTAQFGVDQRHESLACTGFAAAHRGQ